MNCGRAPTMETIFTTDHVFKILTNRLPGHVTIAS